jgi:hypothetical protein
MPISLTTEEVKYLKELVAAGERGRTIAAPSRREGLKRLVEVGYVVSRPMSMHNMHYLTSFGCRTLTLARSTDGHPASIASYPHVMIAGGNLCHAFSFSW